MLITNLKQILKRTLLSLNNPIFKSMAIVASMTLVTKALAFYKETLVAGSFGLNEVIDTFIIAALIPTFVNSVFISSVNNLFIPNYITELKNGGKKGHFQSIVFLMVIGIAVLSTIIIFFSIDLFLDIIYPNQPEANYKLVKDQLFIILPCIFIWGISSVQIGLLEVDSRFFISSITGVIPPLTTILFLFYLIDYLGPLVLAYGMLMGSIVNCTLLLFFCIKYGNLSIAQPIFNGNSRMMIKQLPPKISSGFLSAMNNFVDQFFAGQLVVGSLAALSYANRIPAFGVAIVIMAIGNVLLPHFSRLVNEDLKRAYNYLFKTLKFIFMGLLLAVLIGILLSDWIVEIWLERDQFTHDDTLKVSAIQRILLMNVPFYLCTLIMVKFLTSINKNKFMAWISFANLLINVILNVILIKYYGVFGLAISTSLVLIISSLFYFGYTFKQYKKLN
jgi:putative peptidoglycan lipid II flippase